MRKNYNWREDEPIVIQSSEDLPEFDEEFLAMLKDLGESAIGFLEPYGRIDWDRFYEMLETLQGYDMQDIGGPADNKIQRTVRKIVEW